MVIHESRGDRIFNAINNVLLGLIFLICFYPLLLIDVAPRTIMTMGLS